MDLWTLLLAWLAIGAMNMVIMALWGAKFSSSLEVYGGEIAEGWIEWPLAVVYTVLWPLVFVARWQARKRSAKTSAPPILQEGDRLVSDFGPLIIRPITDDSAGKAS